MRVEHASGAVEQPAAIESTIDVERLAQFAGAVRQRPARRCMLADGSFGAGACHAFDSIERFDRPDQNRFSTTLRTGDDVEAERAVNAVDVGVPGRSKHGCVAVGAAAERVARRVVVRVGLGFHDTSHTYAFFIDTHEYPAEQRPGRGASFAQRFQGIGNVLHRLATPQRGETAVAQCNVRGMVSSNSGISTWNTVPSSRCIS